MAAITKLSHEEPVYVALKRCHAY